MATATDPATTGRYKAPAMIEHDRHGRPLQRPYPRARRHVRGALVLLGLLMVAVTAAAELRLEPMIGLVALAVVLLPNRLVRMPHPAFLTLGRRPAYLLEAPAWLRLPDGHAVQAINVAFRAPDTTGDATPPVVQVRCTDGINRQFRPQDLLHVVQPVDLR